MPMLSELPGDATKRDAVLESSNQVAGPEHRKGFTVKERKAETTAATFAAIIGSAFSKTQNVTLGTAGTFDETGSLNKRSPVHVPSPEASSEVEKLPEKPVIPWIQLRPVPSPGPSDE